MLNHTKKRLLVFISHASEDNAPAKRLAKRLRQDGFDPWLDLERLLPGQDWNFEVEKALRASDVILLCFSATSIAKEGYIQKEYKRAMKYQEEKPEGAIFVIPVRLDKCDMPHFISNLQWVDYPEDYDKLAVSLRIRAGGSAMQEKPQATKKPTKKKAPTPKKPGGNVFNIQGGVHIGRDFIGGEQINIHYETTLDISTPADFIAELQQLKAQVEALKSQPNVEPAVVRRLAAVEGDLDDAVAEAKQEAPVARRIQATLDGARETMEKISGSLTSAVNLGTTLGNLALLTMKLFGG